MRRTGLRDFNAVSVTTRMTQNSHAMRTNLNESKLLKVRHKAWPLKRFVALTRLRFSRHLSCRLYNRAPKSFRSTIDRVVPALRLAWSLNEAPRLPVPRDEIGVGKAAEASAADSRAAPALELAWSPNEAPQLPVPTDAVGVGDIAGTALLVDDRPIIDFRCFYDTIPNVARRTINNAARAPRFAWALSDMVPLLHAATVGVAMGMIGVGLTAEK